MLIYFIFREQSKRPKQVLIETSKTQDPPKYFCLRNFQPTHPESADKEACSISKHSRLITLLLIRANEIPIDYGGLATVVLLMSDMNTSQLLRFPNRQSALYLCCNSWLPIAAITSPQDLLQWRSANRRPFIVQSELGIPWVTDKTQTRRNLFV